MSHRLGLLAIGVALLFMSAGRAAEQDYAARFKELREETADAQIEPCSMNGARSVRTI
jgi:hypothetical protein